MILTPVFRIYRVVISPAIQVAFGVRCRYDESCSCYTERMIREHGVFKGAFLGARRVASCNQFWRAHG